MKCSRIALAALGATLAHFAPQLANEFREYIADYRTKEGIHCVMPIGLAAIFVGILIPAVLYAMAYQGGSAVRQGARFGVLLGVFAVCAFVLHHYVNLNIGARLTV